MAFGQDAKEEKAVATLESPIFENIPSQCWHFVFSLNVSTQSLLDLMNPGTYQSFVVKPRS